MPVLKEHVEHTKRKAQDHDGIAPEIIWKTTATVCIEQLKFEFHERLTEAVNKIFDPPLNYWQERRLVGNMELYAAAWSCNYVHFDRNEGDRSQAAITWPDLIKLGSTSLNAANNVPSLPSETEAILAMQVLG